MGPGISPVILILAEADDAAAAWLTDGLGEHGLPVEALTPAQFCEAAVQHRLSDAGVTFRLTLDGGRVLDSSAIAGAVNRMRSVPLTVLARSEPADRTYVEAEWRALLCSLLSAVPGRVFDRPHPYSLVGRWRSPPEWLVLAHQAGLPTPQWAWSDEADHPTLDPEAEADPLRVLVIGDQALTPSLVPDDITAACRRLAELVGVSVLEVRLARDGQFTFGVADQLPDLRVGGDPAIAAYARMLSA